MLTKRAKLNGRAMATAYAIIMLGVASVTAAAQEEGDGDDDESETVVVMLQRGVDAFAKDNFASAADYFQRAVGSGELNDAGRAMAYWYVFRAQERSDNLAAASAALMDFLAVAEKILDGDADGSDSDNFAGEFELEHKWQRGRALLSAVWAHEHEAFGRSSKRPVPVRSRAELSYFIDFVSPCRGAGERSVELAGFDDSHAAPIQQLTLGCGGGSAAELYFVERFDQASQP